MKVSEKLQSLRAARRKAFIPYLTAGDPSLAQTEKLVLALSEAGADVIELGVPFSDPVADGPVNQRAAERALAAGVRLGDVLDLAARLRARGCATPLVLFTYLNPLLAMGLDAFAERAVRSGIGAVLIVDLPVEEAAGLIETFKSRGLENVFLTAPTTASERLGAIDAASSAFVYYVSRTGVTGTQTSLSDALASEIGRLRSSVRSPIAIGFGISNPEQARAAARHGDAIVIGSAIVQLIESATAGAVDESSGEKAVDAVASFARSVREALDSP
jgi:tryptophan synthase alpha chain